MQPDRIQRVTPPGDPLARALTRSAWLVLGLCAVALILGSVPGVEIHRDTSNCAGRALGALFTMHHDRSAPCTASYVYDHTSPAGGGALWAALAPVVLGALLVRRRPRPALALAWALAGVVAAVVVLIVTFDLDIFGETHEVALWPAQVMGVAVVGIYGVLALILVGLPLVLIARRFQTAKIAG